MANRLILATAFIAQAEEYGDTFLHLAFADYFRYFEGTKKSPFIFHQSANPIKCKKTRWSGCVNIWNTSDKRGETYLLNQPAFLDNQLKTRFLFVIGWSFRNPDVVAKHKELIRKIFTPVARYRTAIAQLAEQLKKGADHIVGVHIRQTDYKQFAGGKFFFSLDVYKRFMRELESQLPGHTRFLLCSDIKLDKKTFADFDVLTGTGHPVEDNYALATCSYIIGPPSTYTAWASFYGNVPKHFIRLPDEHVTLDSFDIQSSI